MTRVRDSLGRPIRTGQQGGAVYGLVETLTAFGAIDLSPRQYGAVVVFGTAGLAWAQVQVENRLGRGFLRAVPPRPRHWIATSPNGTRWTSEKPGTTGPSHLGDAKFREQLRREGWNVRASRGRRRTTSSLDTGGQGKRGGATT